MKKVAIGSVFAAVLLIVFGLEDLPEGSEVRVLDENRTIRSSAGSFADAFEPLAVHVYQVY